MDGIDFKSPDDTTDPIIFDDQNKSVDGNQAEMSLSAPGTAAGAWPTTCPAACTSSFPTSDTLHTWALTHADVDTRRIERR